MAKIKVELEMEEAEYALILVSVTLAVVILANSSSEDYHTCREIITQIGSKLDPASLDKNIEPITNVGISYLKLLKEKE